MAASKSKRLHSRRVFCILLTVLLLCCGIWFLLRRNASFLCTPCPVTTASVYSPEEELRNAVALSYLVYGCEGCENLSGTVDSLLEQNRMGIILENFGILRKEQTDPASALLDTAGFIREQVGSFRFLCDRKDPGSSFYGAAFCDDSAKCIWIVFSGSVSNRDALACGEFVLCPGLSPQEKQAFALYEEVLTCSELQQGYRLLLSGHSLGGALATMVACGANCRAVTVNGADGIAVDKFRGITGDKGVYSFISNHLTSPANGRLSLMDGVQRLMFLGDEQGVESHLYTENGYTSDTHCAFSFLDLGTAE